MKFLNLFLFIVCLIVGSQLFAQQAKGGCTTVEVTSDPSFDPSLYNVRRVGDDCVAIVSTAYPMKVRYQLQEKDELTGTFNSIGNYQYSKTFSNLTKGTYRVKFIKPIIIDYFTCPKGIIPVFNVLGQFLGNIGTFVGSTPEFSDACLVGRTDASDIGYTFVDIPETGPEMAYDQGEEAIIDVSQSKNYDYWFLAIFENGATHNRYRSVGSWQDGAIEEFNLSDLWGNWGFQTYHTYDVQFVVENKNCKNIGGWNNLNRTFFICPEGTGCRFGTHNLGQEIEMKLSPNPAADVITFSNFEPDMMVDYRLTISDVTGKTIKNMPLTSDRIQISDLSNGIYMVNVIKAGKPVFNTKLVVQK